MVFVSVQYVQNGFSVSVHPMGGQPIVHCEKSVAKSPGMQWRVKEQKDGFSQVAVCTKVFQSQGVPPGSAARSTLRVRTLLGKLAQSLGSTMQESGHADQFDQFVYWQAIFPHTVCNKSLQLEVSTKCAMTHSAPSPEGCCKSVLVRMATAEQSRDSHPFHSLHAVNAQSASSTFP
jgi:hypothetical protein